LLLDVETSYRHLIFSHRRRALLSSDPFWNEIICIQEIIKKRIKEEITEGRIYSPSGKFAKRAKQI